MCIAIANLRSNLLSDKELENCWDNNPDGAGILYKEDGRLKIYKQLTSFSKFLRKYKSVIQGSNCLVHFRVTSAGSTTLANIHPFMVNSNLGLIHNGTIWKLKPKAGSQRSDTWGLTQLLKDVPPDFLKFNGMLTLIEELCGSSKVAFMDNEESFTIINESLGHYREDGNWCSNHSYEDVQDYMWRGNEKVYKAAYKPIVPMSYPTTKELKLKLDPPDEAKEKQFVADINKYNDMYDDLLDNDDDIVDDSDYYSKISDLVRIFDQVDYELFMVGNERKLGEFTVFNEDGNLVSVNTALVAYRLKHNLSYHEVTLDDLINIYETGEG